MNDFPLITAHTGCMGTPDNSVESARAGLSLGADIVEDDIRVTRDGVLVLSHDDRVVLADGRIASLSRLTLQELDAGLAAPIVRLETVLDLLTGSGGQTRMNLDLKTDDCVEPIMALIRKRDLADRVLLTGCEYGRAVRANDVDGGIAKLLNVDIGSFRSSAYAEAARMACEQALRADCFGLNVPYQLALPELMTLASDRGLSVFVWTIGEAQDMKKYAELGVQSITTRDVATLLRVKQGWLGEGRCGHDL
ncbi:glycerophosphodiester phosphodiesterase [Cohnella rhizosphaerae]|uniref:Glycerophosphodiester phosphodiesterase n=1 Tax=Cohnella rhizosphaerae TaxID=1457232 RepID=A0A9X4L542_9BACL|nr:glycerophosphodiester phosphodiesterase [Cohnella rhizosphaerae]MDG0814029.1 glycerophosphodiester phosphodiesterase [Cohnella rhizosphaerae]